MSATSLKPANMQRSRKTKRFVVALYGLAALFILAVSWQSRVGINPDGISYLDVCREILSGDRGAFFNPYWSPLFPALMALAMKLTSPTPASVLPIAHLVVAFFALAGLTAFIFFTVEWSNLLRGILADLHDQAEHLPQVLFGLALFLSAVIKFITTDVLTPDLLVMTIVLAVSAETCRLASRRGATPAAICLGLLLALGYFTKAALFPLGLLLILLLTLSWRRSRDLLIRLSLASVVFFALTAPYIAELSVRQHKLTFGESARLNYAWLVLQNSPSFAGWTHASGSSGAPVHPLLQLDRKPTVFAFENTLPGTLPVWYDPVYFYQGLKAPFDAQLQIKQLLRAPAQAVRGNGKITLAVLAVLVLLTALARRQLRSLRFAAPWLVVWALAAYMMFALVELLPRFVAPFFVILMLICANELFAMLPASSIRLASVATSVGALILISSLVLYRTVRRTVSAETDGRFQQQVADQLKRNGVMPGDKIAILGDPFNVYFAFEDRLQVVATIGFQGGGLRGDADTFWALDAKSQTTIEDRLAGLGVSAIVSSSPCNAAAEPKWIPVAGNHDCALFLRRDQRLSAVLPAAR